MGSVELGANIFRITQTEALLEKQEERNGQVATDTHYKVDKEVRNTIKRLGGTCLRIYRPSKKFKRNRKRKQ